MSPQRRRSTAKKSTRSTAAKKPAGERLQKVLAAAGIASRRECEELIQSGRVEIDRKTVTVLGTRVDPSCQEIRVDGVPLPKSRYVYYVLNKPAGVVSTNRDPEGRMRVIDLVPDEKRLFTIGRLDRSSEGMIIVTNDGELANQLTHPRYGIPKTYRAKVLGTPTADTLQQLRKGIHLAEGLARVASIRVRGRHPRGVELEIVLTEGRNREIRRVLARVGHKVQHLRRIAIGSVRLGSLKLGEYRLLSRDEVRLLRRSVQTQASSTRTTTSGSARGSATVRGQSTRTKKVRTRQTTGHAGKTGPGGRKATKGKRPAAASQRSGKRSQRPDGELTASRAGTVLDYDDTSTPQAEPSQRRRPTKKTKKTAGRKTTAQKPSTKKSGGRKPAKKRAAKRVTAKKSAGKGKRRR